MSKDFTEIDTDTPKGRLLAFCRMYGLSSNREIEKLLDLGNGYFRTPDKGMNTGTLCKIAKRYPTLNLNWLICGCGHIYSQDNTLCEGEKITAVAESHAPYNPSASAFPSTSVAVRIFETLEAFCHPERESLPPHWLMIEKNLLHDRADALVRIADESLSPEYSPGEYLLVGPSSGVLTRFSAHTTNACCSYSLPKEALWCGWLSGIPASRKCSSSRHFIPTNGCSRT